MSELKQKYKRRLEQLGQDPKKSLGQNFLIHEGAIEKIIKSAKSFQANKIIEVGPGLGALTDDLVKLEKPLTLIELDQQFYNFWTESLSDEIQIINKDALKLKWDKEIEIPDNSIFVSNLPYQISSSIVIERSLAPLNISAMVLMFQKEVAERIMSSDSQKSYGILSVIAQSFWEIEKVITLGPSAFWPPPKVSSQVLQFKRKDPQIKNLKPYLNFVKASFAQRRKMLFKNLNAFFSQYKWGKQELENFFNRQGWSLKVRAEQVTTEEFIQAFQDFEKNYLGN